MNLNKVNLSIGIYTNEQGISPIFKSVKLCENHILNEESTKASYDMLGDVKYRDSIKKIIFQEKNIEKLFPNLITIQTLGACGALYLVANTLRYINTTNNIWISNPSWENYESIFEDYIGIFKYTYKSFDTNVIDIDLIIKDLCNVKKGDYVLLQVCCHNPTGIDLTIDQWEKLAIFLRHKGVSVILDFSYQGLADSLKSDALPIAILSEYLDNIIIAQSFSKNMGLYSERVGSLSLLMKDHDLQKKWLNTIRKIIRKTYTVPPIHGKNIATRILNDESLLRTWREELDDMKKSLNEKRELLFSKMNDYEIPKDIIGFYNQKGMFVVLNITREQIKKLRTKYSIYILDNGRVSISTITGNNIDYICNGIKNVLKNR
ncbi:TPA: aminotransferase class I/II-fold pyridoxal phosphate-dependent enzyme [Staphylococcus aureus]|nr:aminotransferase class I/II-fold pyridoxal phosphate-dependent enzyme [Staphylococcus aureus]HDG5765012.1 aminotransferase class I/II-fold pyridoxal phosphate-dependent enzyme [Staphylococcus aureus]HDG5938546.1 aminotransferase class I/II-fold pyridoxal phosphate-dependent enzyme [Staphylococcus aureus]HDJ1415374.1 aminotransferase class I/II-fold pyridoxal phosphate-dependent enzyme [Staphylococcus aureus]